MSEVCPHCRSVLPDYWWEKQLPQHRWTTQQAVATSVRQQSAEQYQKMLERMQEVRPLTGSERQSGYLSRSTSGPRSAGGL